MFMTVGGISFPFFFPHLPPYLNASMANYLTLTALVLHLDFFLKWILLLPHCHTQMLFVLLWETLNVATVSGLGKIMQ